MAVWAVTDIRADHGGEADGSYDYQGGDCLPELISREAVLPLDFCKALKACSS
jgi:hypothetical protein